MSKIKKKANAKKTEQLGMSFGAAVYHLRKQIMFSLIQQLDRAVCFRCGKVIENVGEFSIDHKQHWLDSDDPSSLFWDLDNIAFSHQGCNSGHHRYVPRPPRGRKPFYVWYKKARKQWAAQLNFPTGRKHLGYYATKEEAQDASQQALQVLESNEEQEWMTKYKQLTLHYTNAIWT